MLSSLIPWRQEHQKQPRHGELATKSSARDLNQLRDEFDAMIDRLWEGSPLVWDDGFRWDNGWGCHIEDADDELRVRAEAPGFEPEEIEVKLSGNRLILQAEHREESERGKPESVVRYGKFYRELTLPAGIEAGKIAANYKNGVLEVHLPKGPETQAKRIQVTAM